MSDYLLNIAIGPVQDFIATARRTRDLWFGSYLLSEISKAAACSLYNKGCKLIFPAPLNPKEDLNKNTSFNVANKILAIISGSDSPQIIVNEVKEAIQKRWKDFAQETYDKAKEAIRKDIWQDQIEDVIEFYVAWVPLNNDYPSARERVERILAGRKALRDFIPSKGKAGVPKSSLDGARESVLGDPKKMGREALCKARLKDNEQLDSVGLIKRIASEPEDQIVSVSRIAVDPWVRSACQNPSAKAKLDEIRKICHTDFANRISNRTFQAFPFDGEILMINRLESLLKEAKKEDSDLKEHLLSLTKIKSILEELKVITKTSAVLGEPYPYLAILVADGDRMGKTIYSITSPEDHQKFSQELSRFAGEARTIIQNNHGCLVYSGGDDVLAFLPLDTCLYAAKELHEKFTTLMQKAMTESENPLQGAEEQKKPPTLSVGIGIGHCLESLENLRKLGKKAEEMAKKGKKDDSSDDRDGIAVCVQTRSSDTISVRGKWTSGIVDRLEKWKESLISNFLPDSIPYDFYQLSQEYKKLEYNPESDVLNADILRLLKKKRNQGKELPQKLQDILKKLVIEDLEKTAKELLIARYLANGTR